MPPPLPFVLLFVTFDELTLIDVGPKTAKPALNSPPPPPETIAVWLTLQDVLQEDDWVTVAVASLVAEFPVLVALLRATLPLKLPIPPPAPPATTLVWLTV